MNYDVTSNMTEMLSFEITLCKQCFFMISGGPDEVSVPTCQSDESVAAALKDIKMAIQATRVLQHQTRIPSSSGGSNNTASAATTLDNSTVLQTQPLQQQQQSPPSENGISEDPWIKRPSQSTLGQR